MVTPLTANLNSTLRGEEPATRNTEAHASPTSSPVRSVEPSAAATHAQVPDPGLCTAPGPSRFSLSHYRQRTPNRRST